MIWYVLKMLLLLPLLGGLIWGSLKLTRFLQQRMETQTGRRKSVRIVETTFLGPGLKLAVIEFQGREILVSAGRGGLTRLAEGTVRPETGPLPETVQ